MGVVGGPLVDQPVLVRRPGAQYPARAAAERLAKRRELRVPALEAAEVAGKSDAQAASLERSIGAQRVEVELVQKRRVGGDQLLPLQAVQDEISPRSPSLARRAAP